MVCESSREGRKVGRVVRMLCSSPGSWWPRCDHVMDVEVEKTLRTSVKTLQSTWL